MTGKISGWLLGAIVIGGLLGACRQADEEGAGVVPVEPEAPEAGKIPTGPTAGTVGGGGGEEPSKLSRDEGRQPDGRKAPSPPQPEYRVAPYLPGKPGYVINPFTNNPVDVRGIPPGTLVRDPQDPDKDHKFRIPAAAVKPAEEGGGLTEIPVPEIP